MAVCLLQIFSGNEDELIVGEKEFTIVFMFMSTC